MMHAQDMMSILNPFIWDNAIIVIILRVHSMDNVNLNKEIIHAFVRQETLVHLYQYVVLVGFN